MKLSIITINFNNKEGLQKTIDSVIGQTWRDFEWIVIDGGSADGSKELIEQYQQNFAFWCSEPDKGVYNAMNKGIAKAKGEYLNFLNSGDVFFESSTLDYVFQKEISITGDIVYGDAIQVEDGIERSWTFPRHVDLEYFCFGNICHQAMFIKTSLLRRDGYDESYKLYADWARWIHAFLEGAMFQYIPVVICRYEMGGMSSRDSVLMKEEYEKIIRKVPTPLLNQFLIANYERKKRLAEFESRPLVTATLALVKEGKFYENLIFYNLTMIKSIKKILNMII